MILSLHFSSVECFLLKFFPHSLPRVIIIKFYAANFPFLALPFQVTFKLVMKVRFKNRFGQW